MSWNNRIMRHIEEDGSIWYGMHEVFYDDDGKISGWTEDAVLFGGESLRDLIASIVCLLKDFWKSRHSVLSFDMTPESSSFDRETIDEEIDKGEHFVYVEKPESFERRMIEWAEDIRKEFSAKIKKWSKFVSLGRIGYPSTDYHDPFEDEDCIDETQIGIDGLD